MEQNNIQSTNQVIAELEKKIDKLQHSIDSLNKIFKITLIVTIALFILPLIGLLFVIPQFVSTLTQYSDLLK